MPRRFLDLGRAVLRRLTVPAVALGLASGASAEPATPTAFVNVTMVPMDSERVPTGHTVMVENGRIAALGRGLAVPTARR